MSRPLSLALTGVTVVLLATMGIAWFAQMSLDGPQSMGTTSSQAAYTWDSVKAYSREKKKEALAYGRQLMRETDIRIAELEIRTQNLSGEAKAKYERELAALKETRANTAARLERIEKEPASVWEDVKAGFADVYRDLQRAYHRLINKFK
jgi:hypothetical protein